MREKPHQGACLNTGRRRVIKSGLAAALGAPLLRTHPAQAASAGPGAAPSALPSAASPVTATPRTRINGIFEQIKREATPEELYRFLYAMPKGGDIHHHLGGGFLPQMWLPVATDRKRNGGQRFYTRFQADSLMRHPLVTRPGVSHLFLWQTLNERHYRSLPRELQRDFKPLDELTGAEQQAWMSAVVLDQAGEGRDEFFEYHWPRLTDLLRSIHVVSELLVENMKLFSAEGVRYLEIMRGMFSYCDAEGLEMPPGEADKFWAERLARPDAVATGVSVRWQSIVVRFLPDAEEAVRAHFAHMAANPEHWVGINMAGREDDNRGHPRRFTHVYDEMLRRHAGVGIAIHAGEAEKPDSHIRDTLRLGASRIGHGINLIWDDDTLLRMRDSHFLVEINLISNELLGYVPNLDQHPFPIYLRQGIACCLNTDDRGMWDSNLTDEYFVAVKRFDLSWQELKKMGLLSYERSFAEQGRKRMLLEEFESDLAGYAQRFEEGNWRILLKDIPAVTHAYGRKVLGLKPAQLTA